MAPESPVVGEKRKSDQAFPNSTPDPSPITTGSFDHDDAAEQHQSPAGKSSNPVRSSFPSSPIKPEPLDHDDAPEQPQSPADLGISDPVGLTMDLEEPYIAAVPLSVLPPAAAATPPPKYPPGVRFVPRDAELVVHYLMNRMRNLDIPSGFVNEVDLYQYHPRELVAEYRSSGEDAWYFLTRRSRKYPNGKRPDRTAGPGYWKATGVDREVKDNGSVVVGLRSSLVYLLGKQPGGKKTSWKMHEYKTIESKVAGRDNWVLCKVYTRGADVESKLE